MLEGNLFFVSYGALWVLMVMLYAAVFLLYRYHGNQLLLNELGPVVGKSVSLDLATVDGATYSVGKDSSRGAAHLIVFVQPNCPFCDRLQQLLSQFPETNTPVVVVYSADKQRARSYVEKFAYRVITVADPNSEIARLWNVRKMPYFVVVDSSGVVRNKGGMLGPDSLRVFLEATNRRMADT